MARQNTRPGKRAKALIEESREAMRQRMSFGQTLSDIERAEDNLFEMIDAEIDPSSARVGAIKAILDSKWKRIDRLLPPLKAIELSGEEGKDLVIRVVTGIDRS